MSSADDQQDDPRFEAVLVEYLRRIDKGEHVDQAQFIATHPEVADAFREYFETAGQIERLVASPEETLDSDGPSTAVSSPLDVIRYFGDYELLEEVGRGGMGVVYRARQVSLNRTVALKMILAGQLASEDDVKRFYTEAEAAANLDHPGIVPIFEVGLHRGQHYFSMGYVEGESLGRKIAKSPLPPREAAKIMVQVTGAVAYAHEHGVIHRDLKPANVLIDQDGQPRIVDFGLAKRVEGDSDLTKTGQIMGTPSYMSPEQATGSLDEIGPATDVYSLGAILYTLLAGRPPFRSANVCDTLDQVKSQAPVSPRHLHSAVPRDLETICLKCLEKERHRRYASAQGLSEELQRYLNGQPILARPISRTARVWRWCRRKPLTASLIAASAIFMVSVIVLLQYISYTRRHHTEQTTAERNENERKRAATLIESLLTARAETVPYAIQNLEPLREHARPALRARFDQPDIDPTRRLHVACALAAFGEFNFAFPFADLKDASTGDCSNVVDALEDAPDAWLSALDDQIDAAGANEDWPFKARLAVVALHLGKLAPAEDMLEIAGRPDPTQRTVFIETFANWHGELGQLTQHVAGAEHPGLRSGICLAVGSIGDIDPEAMTQWQELLKQWFVTQPDGGTHSAAGWALRQWSGVEPPIDNAQPLGPELDWTVTDKTGLTMIRIPAGHFEGHLIGKIQTQSDS